MEPNKYFSCDELLDVKIYADSLLCGSAESIRITRKDGAIVEKKVRPGELVVIQPGDRVAFLFPFDPNAPMTIKVGKPPTD